MRISKELQALLAAESEAASGTEFYRDLDRILKVLSRYSTIGKMQILAYLGFLLSVDKS